MQKPREACRSLQKPKKPAKPQDKAARTAPQHANQNTTTFRTMSTQQPSASTPTSFSRFSPAITRQFLHLCRAAILTAASAARSTSPTLVGTMSALTDISKNLQSKPPALGLVSTPPKPVSSWYTGVFIIPDRSISSVGTEDKLKHDLPSIHALGLTVAASAILRSMIWLIVRIFPPM
mgnify:CR=1 FL=1